MIKFVSSRATTIKSTVLFIALCLCFTLHPLFSVADARVYIDITSPAIKKLPLAVSEFSGPSGREIADIIRDDLDFTGIFLVVDGSASVEAPSQPFDAKNWSVLGVEVVVKGTVKSNSNSVSTVSLYDVGEGKEIFKKEYQAEAGLTRPLAHTIANDIYKQITNEDGIFRTRIAYIARSGGHDELSIMDWDGQRVNRPGIKGSLLLSPRWSKDGSKLIYSAERNRQWNIYLLDFKKQSEKKVFSARGTNLAGDFFPNADEFALASSMSSTSNIYLYRISESRIVRLTSSRSVEVTPTVSPDGTHIAFVSDRQGSPQIFIMDKEGYNIRRLTFSGPYNTAPSWSPKGDKIVFSGRDGGRNQIFTINVDGSGIAQLTDRGNNEDPSLSPDGRYIVFTSDRDGGRSIYIMRANGEAQKRITPKGMLAFGPRWSPN
ncbi:MAG TPA: Tol-Pal system beta propeller repeat protein TolB [Nitrospiraceae bacterium]|jgi:TolB protein|nr:Tol-Pal system beta propeller repeat protein TolB [Nitrospiraceae bacterium]